MNLKDIFDYHEDGYLTWKISPKYDINIGDKVGYIRDDGYIMVNLRSEGMFLLHRLIYEWHHGYCPDLIDHRDKDHTNNRIDNLRPGNKHLNAHNSDAIFGKVPYRGVSISKTLNKYVAYLKVYGKRTYLGSFNTAEEASIAYEAKRKEVVGYV